MYSTSELGTLFNTVPLGPAYGALVHLLTDSRTGIIAPGSIFFALKGKRRDGHSFITDLYRKGVRCFIVEKLPNNGEALAEACFIQVTDTLNALQVLARFHRKKFNIEVIGITGSNGKTVTKEWLYQLMREDKVIVRSPKSYNSQIGVPLSLWQLHPLAELGIFEAGISQRGEMERLEVMIAPTIGILTNLGSAHDENFKSKEEKLIEKLQLFKHANCLIYCGDDGTVQATVGQLIGPKLISWGRRNKHVDYFIEVGKDESGLTLLSAFHSKGGKTSILLQFSDEASIENAIHCWVLMKHLGYSEERINDRMQHLSKVEMRLEMKEARNNCILINDSYNSDLGSLTIAIDFLNQQQHIEKKTVILSDILQSGRNEVELYKEVAALLEKKGIDRFFGIGEALMRQRHLFTSIDSQFFIGTLEFIQHLHELGIESEAILLKGARSFGFERIDALMQQKAHETIMEINLNALVHNLNHYRSSIAPTTKIMAMVKASSYGSGSFEISNVLQFHQVDYLAVAYADEGVELRKRGITLPIMVMNPEEQGYSLMLHYNLEPEIFSLRILKLFIKAIYTNGYTGNYKIHLKLDTGMHRLGFEQDDLKDLMALLKENRNLIVASVFSHLAAAEDIAEDAFSINQCKVFETMASQIRNELGYPFLMHILNSAGVKRFSNYQFDMVRLGIGLYGIGCSESEQRELAYVHTLKTSISQIKLIGPGESIGYNRSYIASKLLRVATLPIGYADGMSRNLSNGKGGVTIQGKRAPILGKVCMDMCMVDVTHITCKEGDEAIVFGNDYTLNQFAKDADTIPYEILSNLSVRVKRIYIQE